MNSFLTNFLSEFQKLLGSDCLALLLVEAFTRLAGQQKVGFERNLSEERNTQIFAHLGGSARDRWEDLARAIAVRANEATHVFNNTEHSEVGLFAEVYFLSYVRQSNFLGRCYNHST